MRAELQTVPLERALYVRIVAESISEEMLLKLLEYETPTFTLNQKGELEGRLTARRGDY